MNELKNIDARAKVIEIAALKAGMSYHDLNLRVRAAMSQLTPLSYYEYENLVKALAKPAATNQNTYIRL